MNTDTKKSLDFISFPSVFIGVHWWCHFSVYLAGSEWLWTVPALSFIFASEGALDGLALRLRQVFRKLVQLEPGYAVNLNVARLRRPARATAKDDFELIDRLDRADEHQFGAIEF